ncbi:MAG: ABC transporter ATP-binding protein [Chloroflexi bacterium]|nr:ABC transporter ATP-binding protein [Chloroflexota bacterium]MCC6893249.1 ABC transporter ATP-binding protein [Anaerolineae bacterium]
MATSSSQPLVEIRDLYAEMVTFDGVSKVLNGVNLTINKGDLLGLVGETGCGKSVTAMTIPRLVPQPPARYTRGEVLFRGENVLNKQGDTLREMRAQHIGIVFQDPMTGLNPVFTVEQQMVDAILSRQNALSATGFFRGWMPSNRQVRKQAQERAIQLLRRVGIPEPEKRIHAYPHEYSGGMRQRVLIAMAISGRPELLIADEPTTALDVSVQAQILRLIAELVREIGLTVLLITHNIGVVAQLCNRIAVMYAGNVVESGLTADVLRSPKHPYTQGLLKAIPDESIERGELVGVAGSVPSLLNPPPGCRFAPRCAHAREKCTTAFPPARTVEAGHDVSCVLYE